MGRFGSRWPGGGGGAPSAAVVDPGMNGGRLSVDSSDPLGEGTSETLYFLPYKGNKISLWNPATSKWEAHEIPDEGLQMAYNATNLNGGGTISYSVPYDVVCYLSGGVPTLGPWSWESTADRDSSISRADGVWSINGEKVYRVVGGVMLINSSGAKFYCVENDRRLQNAENDVEYVDRQEDPNTTFWPTNNASGARAVNNNSTVGNGWRHRHLTAFPHRPISVYASVLGQTASSGNAAYGIGIVEDAETTPVGAPNNIHGWINDGTMDEEKIDARYDNKNPDLGLHFLQVTEVIMLNTGQLNSFADVSGIQFGAMVTRGRW